MEPEFSFPLSRVPSKWSILSQIDQVHVPTSRFPMIYLNIILIFTPGFSNLSLSISYPHQIPVLMT